MFTLHHIALSVTRMETATAFYSALGFAPVYSWVAEDGQLAITHLKQGEMLLELFCFQHSVAAPATSGNLASDLPRIGIKHFGMKVADIHAALQHMQAAGYADDTVQVVQGRTGIDYFFIKDPDGILLEIVRDDRGL